MRELSIKEKAKAYDEALEKAKELMAKGYDVLMPELFPELAESEEEKIRKDIIDFVRHSINRIPAQKFNKYIVWLEKQGEQKPILDFKAKDWYVSKVDGKIHNIYHSVDKVEPKFKVGDIIRLKDGDGLEWTVEEVLNNGYYTIVCADRDDFIQLDDKWELVEQKSQRMVSAEAKEAMYDKPAWSEEDKEMFDKIRSIVEKYAFSQSAVDVNGELCEKEYIEADNWLKSLKEKYTWKPSIAQLNALSIVSKENAPDDIEAIVSLYNDLKKLTE